MTLAELLAVDIFQFFLVVTRIGAAIIAMPGLGGTVMPVQARLAMTLAISLLVVPIVAKGLPPIPVHVLDLAVLLVKEVAVGAFLGLSAQAMMSALNLTGTFMAMQSGLASVLTNDPVTQEQSSLLPGLFANVALVLIFATNTHHLMLEAVISSYDLFRAGAVLPTGDLANVLTHTVGESFGLGVQLAGPVVIFGVVFNGGLAIVNKLMPQMQVFFVAMPVQVLGGLAMVMVTLPMMMMLFLRYLDDGLSALAGVR